MPIATATGTSNPLNGSLPVEVVVPVVPVPELELTAPVEPVDDDVEPALVDPDELEPDELEPEPEEPLELLPLLPLRGSTYCWSPAEEPDPAASADTGARSPRATTTSSERSVIRRNITVRVLQGLPRAVSSQ
jgi:hypothetical protein